ncbi:MAG: polysaccharide deacetylase family protein [Vicingaceae bacterium]
MDARSLFFSFLRFFTFNFSLFRPAANELLILVFHQVNDEDRPIYKATPINVFEGICHYMKKHAHLISFSDLRNGKLSRSKMNVLLTFDDGHYDIIENAMPIAEKLGVKFNVNIDTEVLETGLPQDNIRVYDILNSTKESEYFNPKYTKKPIAIQKNAKTELAFSAILKTLKRSERRDFSNDIAKQLGKPNLGYSKMCSAEDILDLDRKGIEIGSHTHSHPMLVNETKAVINEEFQLSKKILEDILQKEVDVLAYPNGMFTETVDQLAVNSGYKIILKTEGQANVVSTKFPQTLNRVNIYQQSTNEALAHAFGFIQRLRKTLSAKSN